MLSRERLEACGYVVLVLAALLACDKDGDKKSSASGADAKIGEQITFEDSEWTVTAATDNGKALKCIDGEKKTEGKYVTVEFKVKNTSKKEETILDHPKIVDDSGREFGVFDHQSLCLPTGKKSMILEQLQPSIGKEFSAIYEVAGDAKGLKFMARELAWSGDKRGVVLGF
jgi:hypothetical protein